MIYTKNGEKITSDGHTFAVGERIMAKCSDYAGLKGCITEIRTGLDKETENATDDIYCSVPSQQKWTQKSLKKRNESQYFLGLRKLAAFIPRFT